MEKVQSNGWAFGPFCFSKGDSMRYHYDKPDLYSTIYGITHRCDHPVYDECTLFEINEKGLAVIQQRYDSDKKTTSWGRIDPWLADEVYLHKNFSAFFEERAGLPKDGLYPTVTIRQIMWGLKMKPLKRERWETCFDRRIV